MHMVQIAPPWFSVPPPAYGGIERVVHDLTEAAARGTPVVAYRRGSAPEIVVDGVTGILCDDEAGMVAAIPRAMSLDPAACRAHAESTFDRPVIARQYADLYAEILADREARESVPGQSFVQTGGEDGTGAENWA